MKKRIFARAILAFLIIAICLPVFCLNLKADEKGTPFPISDYTGSDCHLYLETAYPYVLTMENHPEDVKHTYNQPFSFIANKYDYHNTDHEIYTQRGSYLASQSGVIEIDTIDGLLAADRDWSDPVKHLEINFKSNYEKYETGVETADETLERLQKAVEKAQKGEGIKDERELIPYKGGWLYTQSTWEYLFSTGELEEITEDYIYLRPVKEIPGVYLEMEIAFGTFETQNDEQHEAVFSKLDASIAKWKDRFLDAEYHLTWKDDFTDFSSPDVPPEEEKEDEKENVEITVEAEEEPGETEADIPLAIVVGSIAAGAAAAGAVIGGSDGNNNGADPGSQSSYSLRINKDFGDTISPGEEPRPVFARIIETRPDGKQISRSDMTSRIQMFSGDDKLTVDDGGMSGDYRVAMISADAYSRSDTGMLSFRFVGKGGSFTENVVFKIAQPKIIFYQDNIALVAKDPNGAALGFTVEGLDPEKTKIELKITGGSSYTAAYIQGVTENDEPVPGTYFAVIGDINEDEGEAGTYAVHTLEVLAYDDRASATGEIDIYRVTTGLNVGTDTLNCYRVLKKEAAGKNVDDLTASDFDISYTKVPAMILKVDEEAQEMYYVPAICKIRIEPVDKDDSLMQERLKGLGIESELVAIEDSIAGYVFYCKKGYLEPPLRINVHLSARTFDPETGEEYSCEKEVMLLSQPMRQSVLPSDIALDDRIKEWMFNIQDLCHQVDGIMDQLCCEYMLMNTLYDSYDKRFGFDPILIAQLQKNVELGIYRADRIRLQDRQRYYERVQATAHADNNIWSIWSKSFAMVSDKYLDNWGGIITRIALGIGTGGLSEVPFTLMDINKAVNSYNERTLLCDRTMKGKLIAGATPVVVSFITGKAIGGVFKLGGATVKVLVPAGVKTGLKNWAVRTTNAVVKKIPEKWILGSKNLYKCFRTGVDKINSYDPRKYLYGVRKAAAQTDALNSAAKKLAQKEAIAIRNAPRSYKGQVMDKLEAAANLNAANKISRFKKAWDRYQYDKSGKALKEVIDSGVDIMEDTFALNQLNADGKTAEQIASKAKVSSKYRAGYNWFKSEHVDEPVIRLIRQRTAAMKKVAEDKVLIYRATGKTAEELKKGFSSSYDSDVSDLISDPKTGMTQYLTQAESEEIVSKSVCDVLGRTYEDTADAVRKSSRTKWVTVTPDHLEYYKAIKKFKTNEAFNKIEIATNMKTGKYKMTYGMSEMDEGIEKLVADKAKTDRVLKECDQFLNREIKSLSQESLDGISYMEKGYEACHQGPKTYDLYVGKDIHAQSMGLKSGFSQESRVTVETLRLVENQGQFHLTLGAMNDLLNAKGSSYQKAVSDMVLDFRTVNANCQAANNKAGSFFWNTAPGSALDGGIAGAGGAVGSELTE